MKCSKITLSTVAILLAMTVAVVSCKKEDPAPAPEQTDTDTQSAKDNDESDFIVNDAATISDQAENGQTSFKTTGNFSPLACATVTKNNANPADPDTIIIDFGTVNCMCIDGRNRRGIINIVRTGNKWTSGSFRTITFSNYFVNDHQVEGIHTITANGKNTSGQWNWSINAQNMKITNPNGTYHTWNSNRTRTLTVGDSLTYWKSTAVYSITGTANGTNVNGVSYTADITNALMRHLDCHWFEAGTIVIKPANKLARTLDFGTDGTCDNQATVSIGNKTYNITLH